MDSSKQQLQATIYRLLKSDPFLGMLIQEVNLTVTSAYPTAFMGWDKKHNRFMMGVNPDFFDKLKVNERVAVIKHELMHFTHMHLRRMKFTDIPDHEKILWNIAADMAINQYIKDLPSSCVKVSDWKQQDGSAMPEFKTMEFYYEALSKSFENKKESEQNKDGQGKPDWRKDFQDRKEGQKQDKDGNPQWGTGPTNYNDEKYDSYKQFDQHDWENLSQEEQEKFLREMKDTFERTIEKSSYSHSNVPDSVKDLLKELSAQIKELDYKGILKRAIKASVVVQNRLNTWHRPNKRYGVFSPGTTVGKLPLISVYVDTSGSMSIREINEAIEIINNLTKVGAKELHIGLWHTNLYYHKKHKRSKLFEQNEIQSGGTDLTEVLEDIKKKKPELSLVITDGYYSDVPIKLDTPVIFLIRGDNNLKHPCAHIGVTIPYSSIK